MEKIIKKEKLLKAAQQVPIVAEKEKWVVLLDKEEGTLYYSPKKISKGAKLYQISDEYALYLDKNFNPKGVMIEYYGENFLKHHKLFIALSKEIFSNKRKTKKISFNKTQNSKTDYFKALLESTLIKEAGTKMLAV